MGGWAVVRRVAVGALVVVGVGLSPVPGQATPTPAAGPPTIPATALPENSGQYGVRAVDDRGDVLLQELTPPTRYAVSGDHGLVDLVALIGPDALGLLDPADLSASGRVVGRDIAAGASAAKPFWADLGPLTGGHLDTPAGLDAEAMLVGADGTMAGISWPTPTTRHVAVWEGTAAPLRTLERPGASMSWPIDLDDSGHLLAAEENGSLGLVLWDVASGAATEITTSADPVQFNEARLSQDLDLLIPANGSNQTAEVIDLRTGATVSYPAADRCNAISPAGLVVCGTDSLELRDPATGTTVAVGTPPGATSIGWYRGVNRRGQIVTNATNADASIHAWLWDPVQGFNELLPPAPGSASPSISESGRVVGSSPGYRTGWITPPLTPDPPTSLEGAAGATGVALRWAPGSADPGVGLAGYRVWRDGVVVGDTTGGSNTFLDSGAPAGRHTYAVRSLTIAAGSAPVVADVVVAPVAPTSSTTTTVAGPGAAAPVSATPTLAG